MCSTIDALKGGPHGVLGLSLLLSVCIRFIYCESVDAEQCRGQSTISESEDPGLKLSSVDLAASYFTHYAILQSPILF